MECRRVYLRLMLSSRVYNWLFYGHIWIALAATGLSWLSLRMTYGYQDCVSEWPVLSFIFFSTLGIYTLHRYLSFQRAGKRPTTRRYEIVKHHPRTSLFVGGASLLIACGYGLPFISSIWPAILLALPVTIFYLTPPLKGWRRLRDLPYLKNLWVAVAWTIMTVVIPVLMLESMAVRSEYDENSLLGLINLFSCVPVAPMHNTNFGVELVSRFLFTGCIALLFDLRDVALDRSQGVRTIAGEYPGLHLILVYSSLVTCSVTALFQWHFTCLTPGFGEALSVAYLLMIPLAYFTYQKTSEDWFAVVVNGLLLLPTLVYWLADVLGAGAGAGGGL